MGKCLKCGKEYDEEAGRKSLYWCPECDEKRTGMDNIKCSCGCKPTIDTRGAMVLIVCRNCGKFATAKTMEQARERWDRLADDRD